MKPRRTYSAEFKQEAVRLSEQPNVSVMQVAEELGISKYNLHRWRKAAHERGSLAFPGKGKIALTEDQQENQRLRRELEQVKQERDILKKAVGFFAKESK